MGNTTSDVNDSLKAQADSENGPELYKLVNVSGTGKLGLLMKSAVQSKNYSEVDEFIKTEVIKFLYNDGQGAQVPIEKIVNKRSGNKISGASGSKAVLNLISDNKKDVPTKEICFDVDKVGAVGETLLHLCMLIGTPLYIDLAKRLIRHFPKMVNDIYLSEDYFGEAALHMAIVSEDAHTVKFLLSHGADVHQRCNGKFFCPDDQKNNKELSIYQEVPIFPVSTNYVGYAYFGEYPLSFAAILNQEECVRLLIAYGADPNKQDFNGNTVLHMLVINNNLEMFKLMLEFNASLHIKNRQGLTPLCLAAKLARKEMFQFILEKLRHVWFTYADISCGTYPMATIDTIAEDGSTDTTSAIYLVVNGTTEEHLELLEGFVVDLLNQKWNAYLKRKYYLELLLFFVFFFLCIAYVIMKRIYYDSVKEELKCPPEEVLVEVVVEHGKHLLVHKTDEIEIHVNVTESSSNHTSSCNCVYLDAADANRFVRLIIEFIILGYSAFYLIIFGIEFYIQRLSLYTQTLLFNPSKVVFILSLVCYFLIVPMRLSCTAYGEDILTALAIIFQSTYILYLGRGFKPITTFVFIIHRGIKTNFFRFVIIISVFMFGFSQAFYLLFNFGIERLFTSPIESFFDLFVSALRFFDEIYETMIEYSQYAILGRILFLIFVVMVALILINLFIAMMINTYNMTSQYKREWLRQWSKQVLTIEQNVRTTERLKQQKKYASTLNTGEKALVVRWKQTPKEREGIRMDVDLFKKQLFEHANSITN